MNERDFNKIFATNLNRMLKDHDMTQADLARRLDVSEMAVSSWTNAQKSPRMSKIDRMCEIFNCTRQQLLADGSAPAMPDITDEVERDFVEDFRSLNDKQKLRLLLFMKKIKEEER